MSKLRDEELKVNMSVNGSNEVQQKLAGLEKQNRALAASTEDLRKAKQQLIAEGKKETEEYKKITAEIGQNNAAIKENKNQQNSLRKEIGVTALTMSQLRKEQQRLNIQLNNTTPNTPAFNEIQKNLKEVNARYSELKKGSREVEASVDGLSNSFGSLGEMWRGITTGDIPAIQNGFNGVKSGIAGATKSALAFIATPIGAALAVLAGMGLAAKGLFDYNKGLTEMNTQLRALGVNASEVSGVRNEIKATADAFDKDFKEIAEKANSLSKSYGISMSEANDIIARGLADGGAQNDEFLDSLGEYDEFFAKAGYSAKDFADIINTGYDLGIYSDKLPDALKEADLALKEQTKSTRDALTNAFGASFTDDILARVSSGKITTKQALDEIAAKAKESGLNQQQYAQLTADVFKGAGEDAGGAQKVFEALGQSAKRELDETANANLKLVEANEKLNKAQSELFEIENFGEIWTNIKTAAINAIASILEGLNKAKPVFKAIGYVFKAMFAPALLIKDIKEFLLNALPQILQKVSPLLKAIGVDVDKLQKSIEGLKSKEINITKTESNKKSKKDDGAERERLYKLELKKQAEIKAEADKKAADKRAQDLAKKQAEIKAEADKKAADKRAQDLAKKKAEEEKAAKEEYAQAKAIADAKAGLAKAQLDSYISGLRSNIDKEKALTPESIAAENLRLEQIKNAQIKFGLRQCAEHPVAVQPGTGDGGNARAAGPRSDVRCGRPNAHASSRLQPHRLNSSILFAAKNLINDAGQLGLPYDREVIRFSRKAFLDLQRDYRGSCVEALPLDAGFDGPVMGERPAAVR